MIISKIEIYLLLWGLVSGLLFYVGGIMVEGKIGWREYWANVQNRGKLLQAIIGYIVLFLALTRTDKPIIGYKFLPSIWNTPILMYFCLSFIRKVVERLERMFLERLGESEANIL